MSSALPQIDEQIEHLFSFVRDHPRNARAMARLSCLLVEQAKALATRGVEDERERREAMEWATKSVQLAPHKSFGYAALSVAAPGFDKRMEALSKAVDTQASEPSPSVGRTKGMPAAAFAGALARLLVEPRDEEKRQMLREKTDLGRASPRHPCRRDLNEKERDLYEKVAAAMEMAEEELDKSSKDRCAGMAGSCRSVAPSQDDLYISRVHYRLGLFFRKMQPSDVHRPCSRRHFYAASNRLPVDHPMSNKARFYLATFSEDDIADSTNGEDFMSAFRVCIDRCPEEYIVSLYSSFASNFDELLVNKLQYKTPTLLRRMVSEVVSNDPRNGRLWARRGADLGCGTGLSGVAFRDCTRHLIGVDLSKEMVEKARERKCYDEVVVGDVECVLHQTGQRSTDDPPDQQKIGDFFDLIFACDVFVYMGDLQSIFHSVSTSLVTKGIFAFSTEHLDEQRAGDHPYVLQACARFAHKHQYIEGLAKEFDFDIKALKTCPIRKNAGKDVEGMLVVLEKT